MELQDAYKVLQAACGIEVGDMVKVLRAPTKSYELGSSVLSAALDKEFVGGTFPVSSIKARQISLEGRGERYWGFPFFCLELVRKTAPSIKVGSHTVEFTGDGIKVGCEVVSKETLEQIWRRVNED